MKTEPLPPDQAPAAETVKEALKQARKALRCLYLEAPESVATDVARRVEVAFTALLRAVPPAPQPVGEVADPARRHQHQHSYGWRSGRCRCGATFADAFPRQADPDPALRVALAALEQEIRDEAVSHQQCGAHCDARDAVLYEWADRIAALRSRGEGEA
jgi:hypothetical protein